MFNRKRPYSNVYGQPGVAYEQDGKLYNAKFEPIDKKQPEEKKDEPKKPVDPQAPTPEKNNAPRVFSEGKLYAGKTGLIGERRPRSKKRGR